MLSAAELERRLRQAYGAPRWWSDDAYTVIFQAVLVQNATWRGVERTCAAIGDRLAPAVIAGLPPETLEDWIRSCGCCRAKARTIQALTAWFGRYGYDRAEVQREPVAKLRQELLAVRGVGEETADVILVYAFYRPAFIVDAYTRRLLARLGGDFADDGAIRRFLAGGLAADARLCGELHWLILEHCIAACRKAPRCAACPLRSACAQGAGS